eukprot:1195982-Prorocentrum_minimum.AAC.4
MLGGAGDGGAGAGRDAAAAVGDHARAGSHGRPQGPAAPQGTVRGTVSGKGHAGSAWSGQWQASRAD